MVICPQFSPIKSIANNPNSHKFCLTMHEQDKFKELISTIPSQNLYIQFLNCINNRISFQNFYCNESHIASQLPKIKLCDSLPSTLFYACVKLQSSSSVLYLYLHTLPTSINVPCILSELLKLRQFNGHSNDSDVYLIVLYKSPIIQTGNIQKRIENLKKEIAMQKPSILPNNCFCFDIRYKSDVLTFSPNTAYPCDIKIS